MQKSSQLSKQDDIKDLELKLDLSEKIASVLDIINSLETKDFTYFNVNLMNEANESIYEFNLLESQALLSKKGLITQLKQRFSELEANYRRIKAF